MKDRDHRGGMGPTVTCRVRRDFVVFIVAWNAVVLVFATAIIAGQLIEGTAEDPVALALFWLLMIVWVAWWGVYRPYYEISLYDDGRLAFRGILRRLEVRVDDVELMRKNVFDWMTWIIRTRGGTAVMPRPMTNKRELANRLCELNPRIDLREI